MPAPTSFRDWLDRLSVWLCGGVRIRVWREGDLWRACSHGRTPGPVTSRLVRMVLDLGPSGEGVIDLRNRGSRGWSIGMSASLDRDDFRQRLRNVIVNA